MASVAGIGLGGPRWPNSPKTISGSAACFLTCVLIGAAVVAPVFGWTGVFVGALVATALEWGIVPGNDNLTIPVGVSVAFLLMYRLRPLAF